MRQQRDDAGKHDDNLQRLGALQHTGFGEAVGKLSGGAREQQEWNYEHRACKSEITAARLRIRCQAQRHDRDDHLVNVVVERAQELGPQESLETAVGK